MIYELRTYTASPGKIEQLHQRFREVTLALFERHGMRVAGFWTPVAGSGPSDQLVYMLAFPDLESVAARWAAFRADPDWITAKAESERDGELTAQVVSQLLESTDYSPSL